MSKTKQQIKTIHNMNTEDDEEEDIKSSFDSLLVSLKSKTEQIKVLKMENIKKDCYNNALVEKIKLLGEEIQELYRQIEGHKNYMKLKSSSVKEYKKSVDDVLNNALDTSLDIAGDELRKYKDLYDDEAKKYANDLLKRLNIYISR